MFNRKSLAIPEHILAMAAMLIISFLAGTSEAKVYKIRIDTRHVSEHSIDGSKYGQYEILKGIVFFQIDPENRANSQVRDLGYAPLNDRGMVEFSAEFELHKPVDASMGNHKLIYFVSNRGRTVGPGFFSVYLDYNWLYSKGYSYVWCGWNADVPPDSTLLNIFLPIAVQEGASIQGKVYSEMISFSNDTIYSRPVVWGNSLSYPPVDMNDPEATLSKRQYRSNESIPIARDQWQFARSVKGEPIRDSMSIFLKEGFIPGWLYDLVYEAKNPKVCGLGMAAIRDLVSFLKYEDADEVGKPNPLYKSIDFALAWGHSQSARLLNHFVHENFNRDESSRMVLDGVMCNCPGAGKGLFNSRFAQTTRHGSHHEDQLYPVDVFPFAGIQQSDPLTGKSKSAYDEARENECMPRMMFINSSTDYWTRAASLLHTDVEATRDLDIASDIRIYLVSGFAHTDNEMAIPSRALFLALDEWVSSSNHPPESKIPLISEGTLVDIDTWKGKFPAIPEIIKPDSYYNPYVLNMGNSWDSLGIADIAPPDILGSYHCLVPQVDIDGNELGGIRMPDIDVPLATYTGWSMRNPSFSNSLQRNKGKRWPLPYSEAPMPKGEDPRMPIQSRYKTATAYADLYVKSLQKLKDQRFILPEDYERLLEKSRLKSALITRLKPMDEIAIEMGADSAFSYFLQLWQADMAWICFTGTPAQFKSEINTKGYQLMYKNEYIPALELFRLNTMIFENDANAWDSMGECYYNLEQLDQALSSYKKSLALLPSNENAREMVEKIGDEINHNKQDK